MSKNHPAFPLTTDAISFANRDFPMQGLTKLEWFAGMIAQGMAASEFWAENIGAAPSSHGLEAFIKEAFRTAEAMIAESEKRR